MSYPSGRHEQPPAHLVDIVPHVQIPCPHCGSVCFRSRVERLGVMLYSIGRYAALLGYLLLIALLLTVVTCHGEALWAWHVQGSYVWPQYGEFDSAWALLIPVLIVGGHLLSTERSVWICAACGSLFDRSERVEQIHAERQRKKQASE